jgi:quinohemoprotein ethanol dehydrogenase
LPAQETVAQLEAQQKPLFFPHKSVVNLGVEVPDIPEDPKALAQIRAMWKGRLIAWDPVAKKPAWVQEYPNAWNGGTLSTAGNLVFQGTADGRVVAYSADKGAKLWESGVNSGAMAGPITYEVAGEQYVTFMVGWGGAFPLITGSFAPKIRPEARVVTFKLGGKVKLPPPKATPVALSPLPPLTAQPDQLKVARELFNGACGSCHGMNAVSGGVVPDLRYLTPEEHAQFTAILSGARLNKGMPAFNAALKPEEMELLQQYIIKRSRDLDAELKANGKQ